MVQKLPPSYSQLHPPPFPAAAGETQISSSVESINNTEATSLTIFGIKMLNFCKVGEIEKDPLKLKELGIQTEEDDNKLETKGDKKFETLIWIRVERTCKEEKYLKDMIFLGSVFFGIRL